MMDIRDFRRALRDENSDMNDDFRRYMLEVDARWSNLSKDEKAVHPEIVDVCGGGSGMPFVRFMYRVQQFGTISVEWIDRMSKLLGHGSAKGFITAFLNWRDKKPSLSAPKAGFEKSKSGDWVLREGLVLRGQKSEYVIQKRLPATGLGASYKAHLLGDKNRWFFVKTLSFAAESTAASAEKDIKHFSAFIKREIQMLQRLSDVENVSRLHDWSTAPLVFAGQPQLEVDFLVTEWVEGETLAESMQPTNGVFRGMKDPAAWRNLAIDLIRLLQRVHAANVRHGDLHSSNIMIEDGSNRLVLIDFGQSGIPAPAEEALKGRTKTTLNSITPERRRDPSMPLEPSEDVFGLATVLFWAATGREFPAGQFTSNRRLRRYVQFVVKHGTPALVKEVPGVVEMLVRGLHDNPWERAASVDELLDTFEQFRVMGKRKEGREKLEKFTALSQEFKRELKHIEKDDSLLGMVFRAEFEQLVHQAREMRESRRLIVSGARHELITHLLRFIATLDPRDRYITTSTPHYWSSRNMGVEGRFWEANRLLVQNGVAVHRLIVTDPQRDRDSMGKEYDGFFRSQEKLARELPQYMLNQPDLDGVGSYTGVVLESQVPQLRPLLGMGYHVGIILTRNSQVTLSFQMDDDRNIRKLVMWDLTDSEFLRQRLERIKGCFSAATPITDWQSLVGKAPTARNRKRIAARSKTLRR